jgi:hypothetical protein
MGRLIILIELVFICCYTNLSFIWGLNRDPHAPSRNLYYVIADSTLGFSRLLTSLTSEKDFVWMGGFLKILIQICFLLYIR